MVRITKRPKILFAALVLITTVALAATGSSDVQTPYSRTPVQDLTDSVNRSHGSLEEKFAKNKKIPDSYKKQILYALSFFPELVDTKIEFRVKKTRGGIISTRPTIGSLLRKSSKRTYVVIINDSTAGRTLPTFANSTVNGQVGILGHELCHIVDFNTMTGLGLVGLGVSHISRRYLDQFEYKTDSLTIERGLGYQLLDWKQYMDKSFSRIEGTDTISIEDPVMRERYMSVEAIRRVIAKSKVYQAAEINQSK
jgi:hypothetical protein